MSDEYLESLRSTRGYFSKPESPMTNALNLSSSEPLTTDETTAVSALCVSTNNSVAISVALTNGNHSTQINNTNSASHVTSSPKLNSKQREPNDSENSSSESSTESEEHDKNSKTHGTKADLEFKLLVKPAFTDPNGIINGILKNVDTLQAKNNVSPLLVKEKHLSSEQTRNCPNKSTPFKQENHQQKKQQQSSAKCNTRDDLLKKTKPYMILLSALLFLFGYICVSFVWKNFGPTSSNLNLQNDISSSSNDALSLAKQKAYQTKFNEHMKFIKSKYSNQTSLFWANIESTYRHSIVKMKDPSIVLMVSDKLTSQTGHELSSDILNAIKTSIEDKQSSNLNNLIINPVDYSDLVESKQFDQVKLIIDNKLNKIFLNGQRVALVRSIQQIPATSMLLFYTYGDDLLSAKYPGVVILMTLEIEDTIAIEKREQLTKNSKKIMEFVETYMFQMWSKFVGEDQLKPLFTRIGNNVVFVNNESK